MQVKKSPINTERKLIYDYLVVNPSSSVAQVSLDISLPEQSIKNALEFFRYHKIISATKILKTIRASNGKFAGSSRDIIDRFDLI